MFYCVNYGNIYELQRLEGKSVEMMCVNSVLNRFKCFFSPLYFHLSFLFPVLPFLRLSQKFISKKF
jgi:hypothetical protein